MTQALHEKLETSIDCVLFDLDGTLIDTAPDFVIALNLLLTQQGKQPLDARVITHTVFEMEHAHSSRTLLKSMRHMTIFLDLLQRLLDLYFEQLNSTVSHSLSGIRRPTNAIGSTEYSLGDRNQ